MYKKLLFLITIGGLLLSPAAQAMEYKGLGGRPAFPRADNPRTSSIFVHRIEPGNSVEDGIRVINNTEETKTILVYSADFLPSSDGGFACKQFVEEKTNVGSWINLEKNEVTLEPGTNELVRFTIDVPENAGVGEHDGCILTQEKKVKDPNAPAGINLSFRSGIRVAVTVPGDINKELEILGFDIIPREDGKILLNPRIKNLGTVSVDADIEVITRYFFGKQLEEHGGEFAILREETSNFNFPLDKPYWGGFFRSTFTAYYSDDTQAELGAAQEKNIKLKGPSVWFFVMPSKGALAIELGVLTLIILLAITLIIATQRKKWIAKSWVDYKVKERDDIKSLSKKHDISWKLMANVNALKAPYLLEKGMTIKVPPKNTTKPKKEQKN